MFLGEVRTSIRELKGVGPSRAKAYASMGILTYENLLTHLPRSFEDRQHPTTLSRSYEEKSSYVIAEVIAHDSIGGGRKKTLKVIISDNSGYASLLCFGRNFLENMLTVGKTFHIYGNFSFHFGEIQCSTFEVEPLIEGQPPVKFGAILPLYPLTAGLTQNIIRRDMKNLLSQIVPYIEDQLPTGLLQEQKLLSYGEALQNLHFPGAMSNYDQAKRTLAYTELFYLQATLIRKQINRKREIFNSRELKERRLTSIDSANSLAQRLIKSLPFTLTQDQVTVLHEIEQDLSRPYPMNRLVQGDVGSGKTLTGFLSMLPIIEAGGQVAFMAPTELLAKQHAESAARFLEPLGVKIALLTGSVPAKRRSLLLEALKDGSLDCIIGTHALFSGDVVFHDLQYAIIDEQQRFGVAQRISLSQKGRAPHLLLMTATPIPRTMALTLFGDLDISTITTMPPGRKPIITHLAAEKSRQRVYDAVKVELDRAHQAYFVYPKIEATEKSELRDVHTMYQFLGEEYPEFRGGLIHSRIAEDEKESIMHQFREGTIQYLVSTSVVEVGVDVPNATCMIIEHAERFGLSALHQLRGRVGRGAEQAYAFLVFSSELQEDGKKRLKVMKESHDGFYIAEQDLLIRGPGEITGGRQSGYLGLVFADIVKDLELMKVARGSAEKVLSKDERLLSAEYAVIRRVFQKVPPFDDLLVE